MTIQRQYSLPNCTLLLDGLTDANPSNVKDARPLISMLVNAECRFTGKEQTLSGGRDFFESLIKAVSGYAQEFLSGVPQQPSLNGQAPLVNLRQIDPTTHRLTVRPQALNGSSNLGSNPVEVNLSTVQLFDLLEAIDQFLADQRTLPDIGVALQPVSKRYAQTNEPVAKRALPAAVGLSGLAAAALAFSLMPIPDLRRPEPQPQTTSQTTGNNTTTPPTATEIENSLNNVPEITEPAKLEELNRKLYDDVDKAWQKRDNSEELIYRVTVAEDGAIIGYKPDNDAATNSKETPLLNLLYLPPGGGQVKPESYADFKVIFTRAGTLQVSPWKGFYPPPSTPTPTASPTVSAPTPTPTVAATASELEITDSGQLETLQTQLYSQLNENWKTKPSFERELAFKVGVSGDGKIIDYTPVNQPASDYVNETPLGSLKQSVPANTPAGYYRVVFTPKGVLQISPWKGFR